MLWGVEDHVTERFGAAGVAKEDISFSRETFNFGISGTPSEFLERFRLYYGPTMNAFDAAGKNGKEAELQQELEDLFNRQNKSGNNETTLIPATFLKVTVARR
ncbi:hypothetical protein [Pseudobacter ginsenosidimutans]|nr:hypothetical protein [Pseudobacter ginsenosidimutans]